ncbi:hypothetical protein DY245_25690 [Streptomyces inhibens]|uniref:Uncharacterized protein n=1 Tax=Streptomyces inhibens TaxID=2293571 RepID=A0A371PYT0_STRIH|nr:hypothetical protein [Streptomyces inhibens]REK87642.1 hypothetical protein DY245_25690 [Streptomyces inhibens]
MPHCIARIFEPLLRLLLPAPGRHRSEGMYPYVSMQPRTDRPPVRSRLVRVQMVRGEDSVMVRPYLVAYERRQEDRLHCACRYARRSDAQGVGLGRWSAHGAEVAAR